MAHQYIVYNIRIFYKALCTPITSRLMTAIVPWKMEQIHQEMEHPANQGVHTAENWND